MTNSFDNVRALEPNERLKLATLVELPYSEVCMAMRVAGEVRPVVRLDRGMTQILQPNGELFSMPVTNGEAGVHPDRMSHVFTLYRHDIVELRAHLDGANGASFDVSDDGFVTVYVAGKEPLKL